MTNSDKVTVQYHMIITKKKRVRKESERTKNGDKKAKKADAPEDRYIAFATNAPWMDVKEYSKRVDHRDMLQTGRERQGKVVRQQ